ncbi:MAG: class I SAM-dependent methyltransferase [Gemmatimonadota bacterium]|nr:class I SAM-dependent methyltransferase [Gemmatimonadota bacterium]
MSESVERFYDDLAADYHHVYADWESGIERQASVLDQLIQCEFSASVPVVLDCSCGIGTQAIGLAQRGYEVFASDLSPKAVARAEAEAAKRGLNVRFAVADVRELECAFDQKFDVVISCDNSLPHLLTDEDLTLALRNIRHVLTDKGLFVASIRDYDRLLAEKPSYVVMNPGGTHEEEVIVFQIWDWSKESDTYLLRLFVMNRAASEWRVKEVRTRYRAIKRNELTVALESVGFAKIAWHEPEQSGYFQPIVTARA